MNQGITISKIYSWLEEVKDPEIPVLSLVDLGVVTDVELSGDYVRVELTPTFAGCPAMEMMKNEVLEKLKGNADIQCICGHSGIAFGLAQKPSLLEYADGVDTMQFLLTL